MIKRIISIYFMGNFMVGRENKGKKQTNSNDENHEVMMSASLLITQLVAHAIYFAI
jgi:hypothetical protein